MKLTLTVMTAGKSEGKSIPITLPQFVIGRDPQCHLRPASALISKRHCALLVRGEKAFIRDFDSTNGTFLNEEAVKGEREIRDKDQLKVGPLDFSVSIVAAPASARPKSVPARPPAESSEDDSAAAMLLALGDDDGEGAGQTGVDEAGIPTGSTVMEVLTPAAETVSQDGGKPAAPKPAAAKSSTGDTSTAAKAILDRYIRRPRV